MNLSKDLLFFGIDELELILNQKKELKETILFYNDIIWEIDDDNSSFAYLDLFGLNFHYSKIYPKGYKYGLKFSTSIDNKIIDCFAILIGHQNKKSKIKSKSKIVFYSSFFILEYLKKLPFSILNFISYFNFTDINRIDLALDLPYTIQKIQNEIFVDTKFYAQYGIDKQNNLFSQTYYIGNPRSDRNRKYIFRIYDKILDTFKKKKGFLYPHLTNQKNVRRVELELRAEECRRLNLNLYDLLTNKNNLQIQIFSNYFNKFSQKKLNYEKINLIPYTNNNLDLQNLYLQYGHIPEDYLRRAHGYIANIKSNTGYTGLFDTILNTKKEKIETIKNKTSKYQTEISKRYGLNINKKIGIKNLNITNQLELLDNYFTYIKNSNINENLIKKIIKKHFNINIKPKIKLN